MTLPGTQILQDIVATLRTSGEFALVTLGESPASAEVPRANVVLEDFETFSADDDALARWVRLYVRVRIHGRSDDPAAGVQRLVELGRISGDALMEEPFRGGKCRHLPIGKATEIGRVEFDTNRRRPDVEVSLAMRCHYEIEGGA